MSKKEINEYYRNLEKTKRFGGTKNEISIKRPFINACYFLINVEGGIGFDLAAGFERVFGRGVEKMATAEDVEGLSFNASLGVFMFDEGLSFNYDKEEKKIGNKFIAHSIGYMPLGTSYLFSGHISI